MLVALKNFPCENEEFLQGVKELNELVLYLNAIADFSENYVLDVSIARGLGYYTGIVYETNLKDLPELGSVCSGGRYDNLTQQYTKERISGVGASFGLDRLLAGMEKLGLLELSAAPAKLICMQVEPDCADYVIQTAAQLRASGLSVEVYPDFAKLKKQFQYAEKKNYQYALILGSAEKQSGLYNLKDLKTQQQHQLSSIAEICNFIS
jgi:histidyl-tRNA synthetase